MFALLKQNEMDKRQFILDTLLPYRRNPNTCALGDGRLCFYLTNDGRKCAVGKHMINGKHQQFCGDVRDLSDSYDLNMILTEEAKSMNISIDLWVHIQRYHDYIAVGNGANKLNRVVKDLENLTGLKFPELYFEV